MPAGDMMSTAVRTIMLAFVVTACAQGGSGAGEPGGDAGGGSSDARPIDGPITGNDAPIQPIDGAVDSMPIDAMIDALPPGSNLFCTASNMCGTGECCFDFFGQAPMGACVTGAEALGVCFPQ
jgi:hypothetical protein